MGLYLPIFPVNPALMIVAEFILEDEAATNKFGANLAPILRPGDVICLQGSLGAGKSTLVRALIRKLIGNGIDIPSPTYTLVESYETRIGLLHHYDLYRLENPEDVLELGIEEAMGVDICLIEWAERIAELLPAESLIASLKPAPDLNQNARRVILSGTPEWKVRLSNNKLPSKESGKFR